MRELLEGRRLGFALRPLLGALALGLALAVTLLDLMAWFGWGARDTNGFVVAAAWLAGATALAALLAAITAAVESTDAADEDRALARLDLLAIAVAVLLYAASAALRAADLGGAGAAPLPFVAALAGLVVLAVDAVIAATLYAAREWQVVDDEDDAVHRHQRRRRAS
jgi:hypothetical protein